MWTRKMFEQKRRLRQEEIGRMIWKPQQNCIIEGEQCIQNKQRKNK